MIKYDYQIGKADIKNANLLLIGDNKTNMIITSIVGDLPLKIREDKITIGNQTTVGRNLGFYMVYPNPKNKDKYIGIIYGDISSRTVNYMDIANREFINLLNFYKENQVYFDISCFGWYDFKIWNSDGNIVDAGFFNDQWQN